MNFLFSLVRGAARKITSPFRSAVTKQVFVPSNTAKAFVDAREQYKREIESAERVESVKVENTPDHFKRKAIWNQLTDDEKKLLGNLYDSGMWQRWEPEAQEPIPTESFKDTIKSIY